jgi:hypothetical protein
MRRLTKEYFDHAEFRILWLRMSRYTDIQVQLQGRLDMREAGIILPKESGQRYINWARSLKQPEERAKALIMLQRTQGLLKEDWEALKAEAEKQFGSQRFLELLREQDVVIAKPKAQEAPTFWRKNLIVAAMKKEESGGDHNWNEQIPRVIDMLRSGSSSEITTLMKELGVGQKSQLEIAKRCKQRYQEWEQKRQVAARLLADDVTLPCPNNEEIWSMNLGNRLAITGNWVYNGINVETEEIVWSQIRDLLEKWEWYGRAAELSQQEMMRHWQRYQEELQLTRVSQRWLPDWTDEMIREEEAEEGWTLELWLWRKNQWNPYYLPFDNDITLGKLQKVVRNYIGYESGMSRDECFAQYSKEDEDKWGQPWSAYTIESLREYPCMVSCPVPPSGLFAQNERIVRKDRLIEKGVWVYNTPGPSHPITMMFRKKWEAFKLARDSDMKQFADKPFEQARKAKAEAREYALTQEYLMEQAAVILKMWANRLAKKSNEDMMSVLEQRLMEILAETRDSEVVTKSQGNLRRLEDQERSMIRKNME